MSAEPLPEEIGRYQVVERIARGGMGVVYRALDPLIGRPVAVKVLHAADDDLRSRFLKEMRFLGTLEHPNIVTVHDCGEYEAQPFIVMEYVDGSTLAHSLRQRTPDVVDAVGLVLQLCSAMEYAHERGVIHRDIKPANLIVDRRGVLKVLDFGVARMSHAEPTRVGNLVGTLNYMSPEQLSGAVVDRRTDIYAVGLVFYELLAGRPAFPDGNVGSTVYAIVHEEPLPLATLRPGLDPAFEQIIRTAIQKDPANRYQTLSAFVSDLSRAAPHLPGLGVGNAGVGGVNDLSGGLHGAVAPVQDPTPEQGPTSQIPPPDSPSSAETGSFAYWTRTLQSKSDARKYILAVAGVILLVVVLGLLSTVSDALVSTFNAVRAALAGG